MVLHHHEAVEFRVEMAVDARWQRCPDCPPSGCDPTFAPMTGRAHGNHETLNQKRLVALEARAGRDRDVNDVLLNGGPRADLARAPSRRHLTGFGGSVPLSMRLRPIRGRPFMPFRRAVSSRGSLFICFATAISPNNSTSRASGFGRLSRERDGGGGTSPWRIERPKPEQEKNQAAPTVSHPLRKPQISNLFSL
jgi:hypothetical protein